MSVDCPDSIPETETEIEAEMRRRFETARHAADAVLFEGYVLYPYRASSAKNRLRWQFGVLMDPQRAETLGERAQLRVECLAEPRSEDTLLVELRFLRVQRRVVESGPEGGRYQEVPSLELDDMVLFPWDEGVDDRVQVAVPVARLLTEGFCFAFERPATADEETICGPDGAALGRVRRSSSRLTGIIELSAQELPVPYRTLRLRAQVRNTTPAPDPTTDATTEAASGAVDRDGALAEALVSAHLVLGLTAGRFLSPTDPPEWAKQETAQCENEGVWPVLAGNDGGGDVVLASPIILEDHPAVAPESPGAMYDLTEIDEILALRTAALTDQEKREARGTDPRAAAVVELADSLPADVLDRLHGAIRGLREVTGEQVPLPGVGVGAGVGVGVGVGYGPGSDVDLDLTVPAFGGFDDLSGSAVTPAAKPWWDPGSDRSVDPARDHVLVDGRKIARGSTVVLRPGRRRTDAQDIFLHGRNAFVEAVLHDVDGLVHIAVTVEGDPGADMQRAQGRFLYFQPDEVEVMEAAP